jgi:hypothetical protein
MDTKLKLIETGKSGSTECEKVSSLVLCKSPSLSLCCGCTACWFCYMLVRVYCMLTMLCYMVWSI